MIKQTKFSVCKSFERKEKKKGLMLKASKRGNRNFKVNSISKDIFTSLCYEIFLLILQLALNNIIKTIY
jgi:hypothetical protein